MRQFRTGLVLAALVLALGSGAALAAEEGSKPEGGRPGGHMAKADTDGDGAVSKAEFLAVAEQRFASMDKNGDGKLTPDERPKRGEGKRHEGGRGEPQPE